MLQFNNILIIDVVVPLLLYYIWTSLSQLDQPQQRRRVEVITIEGR